MNFVTSQTKKLITVTDKTWRNDVYIHEWNVLVQTTGMRHLTWLTLLTFFTQLDTCFLTLLEELLYLQHLYLEVRFSRLSGLCPFFSFRDCSGSEKLLMVRTYNCASCLLWYRTDTVIGWTMILLVCMRSVFDVCNWGVPRLLEYSGDKSWPTFDSRNETLWKGNESEGTFACLTAPKSSAPVSLALAMKGVRASDSNSKEVGLQVSDSVGLGG
jgi:hypothetical protein